MDRLTRELEAALTGLDRDEQGAARAVFSLPPSFVGFAGHFPDNPILPAVAQIQMACLVAGRGLGLPLRLVRVVSAKFTSPVAPEEPVSVRCRADPAQKGRVTASLDVNGRSVAVIRFVLGQEE